MKIGLAQGILEADEEIIAKEASFGNPPQEDCLTCMMCDNQTDCISASN